MFDDDDGDGTRDDGEDGVADVRLRLQAAGPDGEVGTGDDTTLADRVTDGLGAYVFDRLAAGTYRVDVNTATVPVGAVLTTGNEPLDVTLGPGEDRRDADFGFAVPPAPPPTLVVSFESTVVVGQATYGPETWSPMTAPPGRSWSTARTSGWAAATSTPCTSSTTTRW